MLGCWLLVCCCTMAAEPAVTRGDLARALVDFDYNATFVKPDSKRRPEIERKFDRVTMEFFGGDLRSVVRGLNELSVEYSSPRGTREIDLAIRSLRLRTEPRTVVAGETRELKFVVESLYPVELKAPLDVTVSFRELVEHPLGKITIPAGKKSTANAEFRLNWKCGPVEAVLEARPVSGFSVSGGHLVVTDRPLADIRRETLARLDKLKFDNPALADAAFAVRSRCEELLKTPNDEDTRGLRFHLERPDRAVVEEVAALEAGRDPFANRVGEYWRMCTIGRLKIPARIYAPPAAAKAGAKSPLVVALHGAGGDENMFLWAYGAGKIRELADKHGFMVVCPLTYAMTTAPALDAAVQAAALHYSIDGDRVYLIGHSMGAGFAAGHARSGKAAAVCCLAGGGALPKNCPAYVAAGELDPLIPQARLEKLVAAARETGARVEYKLYRGMGHTLMVPEALPAALDFLLAERKNSAAKGN